MDVFPWSFEELFFLLCRKAMEVMVEEKVKEGMEGNRCEIRTFMCQLLPQHYELY